MALFVCVGGREREREAGGGGGGGGEKKIWIGDE